MRRSGVDFSRFPKHFCSQLQWIKGGPVLFLDWSRESSNTCLWHWAMQNGVLIHIGLRPHTEAKSIRSSLERQETPQNHQPFDPEFSIVQATSQRVETTRRKAQCLSN